jgi:hypothetical protein
LAKKRARQAQKKAGGDAPSNVPMTVKEAAAAAAAESLKKEKLSTKQVKSISQAVAAAVAARRGGGRDGMVAARKAAWLARRLSKPLARGAVLPKIGEVEENPDGSITRWVVSPKRLTKPEIHLRQWDKVVMPPNLPMIPALKQLLPFGLSEKGLMVTSPSLGLAAELDLPQHSNPQVPGRPEKINDLFSVMLHA